MTSPGPGGSNEIRIVVRGENNMRNGLDSAGRDMRHWQTDQTNGFRRFASMLTRIGSAAGRDMGNQLGQGLADNANKRVEQFIRDANGRLRDSRGRFVSEGNKLGDGIGDGAQKGFLGRAKAMASKLVETIGGAAESTGEAISGAFSKIGPYALIAAKAAALLIAPVIGAAVTAGLLMAVGGAVLAMGIKKAAEDPAVTAAWDGFKARQAKVMEGFAEPFKAPLIRAAKTFGDAIERIGPALERMGADMAPLIDVLAPALAQMAEKAMPGIEKAVRASVPLFEKLAEYLPEIGASISYFFSQIAGGEPGATRLFGYLLSWAAHMIRMTGLVIGGLSRLFATIDNGARQSVRLAMGLGKAFLTMIGNMLEGAAKFSRFLPGNVGAGVRKANSEFQAFKRRAIGAMDEISRRTIVPRVNTAAAMAKLAALRSELTEAQHFNAGRYMMPTNAHGGIVGAATGGVHGGMRWVGEHGPELVELPYGSKVNPTGQSMRMAAAAGRSEPARLIVDLTGADSALLELLRRVVRIEGGGNVQLALGKAGR